MNPTFLATDRAFTLPHADRVAAHLVADLGRNFSLKISENSDSIHFDERHGSGDALVEAKRKKLCITVMRVGAGKSGTYVQAVQRAEEVIRQNEPGCAALVQ